MKNLLVTVLFLVVSPELVSAQERQMLIDRVSHHSVDNDGVNIHYVSLGKGDSTLLFVHGVPDFWFLWFNQMNALCDDYRCVSMDTRGYNQSDKPEGVENYSMDFLMSDIGAVIDDIGGGDITLITHDFGGLIAWNFVMDDRYQFKVNRLIAMNITHPRGFSRTLANLTPEQAAATDYARILKSPNTQDNAVALLDGAVDLRMETWWKDKDPRVIELIEQAAERTSTVSIAHYYQANYFEEPYTEMTDYPQIRIPVLQFHGRDDPAVSKDGLVGTWDWVDEEYTLVTYPGVGHIPQLQVPDRVNETIKTWLRHN